MLGRDPVDVVAAGHLELEHHPGQPARLHGASADLGGDVEVLTEDAAKVAAREEDGPRAAPAAQTVLLAEVLEVGGHDGVSPHTAGPPPIDSSVDLALAGADDAALPEQLERLAGPLRELPGSVEAHVGRDRGRLGAAVGRAGPGVRQSSSPSG